jgi:uncharacterized membrane protein
MRKPNICNNSQLPPDDLKSAKLSLLILGVVSGIVIVAGIAGFFSDQQRAMPIIGAATVSAIGVSLTSGIVFWVIDIAEHLVELMHSNRPPGKE